MKKNQPVPGAAPAQQVDINALVAQVQQKIPANLQDIYCKAVLSGMRIMFDSKSHQMMQQQLAGPGDMATKISNGIITLMYMLWTQSNKTLPPQIIVPVTLTLTLKAFDFLQQSGDPQATKQMLGQATQMAIQGVMSRFGVGQGGAQPQTPASGAQAPAAAPQAPAPGAGMLDSVGGQ